MQQIIQFFIRNKNTLLFLALFFLALLFTVQSRTYHTNKVVHSANAITGAVFSMKNDITSYFGLREQNHLLADENSKLRKQLQARANTPQAVDSSQIAFEYIFTPAEVINNSYSKTNNFLTLRGGHKQGIQPEMGVISSNGIVGIVDQVSANYSTVLSLLNFKASFSAQLKESGHFGSLVWNGESPYTAQLMDIARLASVAIGDTVVTDGRSTIFPKGIPVGEVTNFTLDDSNNYYIIDVSLFTDMTSLQHVYVIENKNADEIKTLEAENP